MARGPFPAAFAFSSSSFFCSSLYFCLNALSRLSPWLASWAASGASSCHLLAAWRLPPLPQTLPPEAARANHLSCSHCLGFGWSKLSGAGRNHTNKNKVVLVVGLWVNQDGSVLGSGHRGGFSPCVSHPPGTRSPAKASFFLDHDRGTRDQAETLKSSVAYARNWYPVVFSSFNLSKQVTWPNLKSGGGESVGGGGGLGGGRFKLRSEAWARNEDRAVMQFTIRLKPDSNTVC